MNNRAAERSRRSKEIYSSSAARKRLFLVISSIAIVISAIISVSLGPAEISLMDTLKVFGHSILPSLKDGPSKEWYTNIILNGRLSRVVLCILCGFSLAISGAVMQNILRNPLVSPFTLGVSSAASFGAAMAIVMGAVITGSMMILGHEFFMKNILIAAMAFLVSLASIALVILMSNRRRVSRSTIILTGVIISYLFQAGVSAAKYFSTDDALREITLWLLGGMWNASWGVDVLIIPFVCLGSIVLIRYSVKINTLGAGDEVATSLGIDVKKLRTISLIVCTFITSICIAFTGIIGFIGLIAPHITRMIIGNDCRYLFPASGLLGALILLVSDTVARMVISPQEIPVGIILYILGGLFFIWLVTRRNKEVSL